ncbi:unnamed protein product [Mycena citricolor]|uniref:GH16 domain-containing protein n=1 Tax=Mycena citricolor TaxID=2018698 RepID=A0AAD2GRI1_9AGAR|nr:unnamed protein product [Mycena citricolor]CAK5274462.1 unnamed protein product [Mycena citricolor]
MRTARAADVRTTRAALPLPTPAYSFLLTDRYKTHVTHTLAHTHSNLVHSADVRALMSRNYFPAPHPNSPSTANLLPASGARQPPPPPPPGSGNPFRGPQQAPKPSAYPNPNAGGRNVGDDDTRYLLSASESRTASISEKYNLAPDPTTWGSALDLSRPEPDDALHDPRRGNIRSGSIFTGRGLQNVGCIALLCVCIVGLFLGYPVAYHVTHPPQIDLLHVNSSGQMPNIGNWGLIDLDTPKAWEMHKIYGYNDPTQQLQLVFSDEFETEGRTFYPGDDPYWEAQNLHYWSTNDLEWYDPRQITTRGGALEIRLDEVADPTQNHNMNYSSGMMSTWNKFCFTGGLILASVQLPGINNVFGLWPAVWTMGNLGRAGYGATLEGLWPYSYDSCDVGTLPNQTYMGGPAAALDSGSPDVNGVLSYLPGQRLSRCTCKGESHPGPIHADGSYVGRSAPEIDMFEAQIGGPDSAHVGQVSQSAQWAPFDASYQWSNTSANMIIPDTTLSSQNTYSGGIYQQAASVLTTTNQSCYQLLDNCFALHGFQYKPGYADGYVTWITNSKVSWTFNGNGVGADTATEISARPVTSEPMYILVNLAISHSFSWIDFAKLVFPAIMRVDYIRVYQPSDAINIGCDPPERPTQAYINTYIEAYTNPNITTWVDGYGQTVPKNNMTSKC